METIYIRRSKGVISGAVGGGEGVDGDNLSKGPGLGMWTGGGPIGVKRFLVLLLLRKERKSPRHDGRCCPPFVLFRLSPWTPFPHSQHPLFCHLPCTLAYTQQLGSRPVPFRLGLSSAWMILPTCGFFSTFSTQMLAAQKPSLPYSKKSFSALFTLCPNTPSSLFSS